MSKENILSKLKKLSDLKKAQDVGDKPDWKKPASATGTSAKQVSARREFRHKDSGTRGVSDSENQRSLSEKGVHKPDWSSIKSKGGESAAGNQASRRGDIHGKQGKIPAMMEHKQVLRDLKSMPKPNLPKSEEMEMSKCWSGKKGPMAKAYMHKCMMQKSWLKKDDKPHQPGTGEHAAHEVIEHGDSIKEHLNQLPPKEDKKMLAHMREANGNPDWKRSDKNKK